MHCLVLAVFAAFASTAFGAPCSCSYCHDIGVPQVKFSAPVCLNFTASLSDGVQGLVKVGGVNVFQKSFTWQNPPAICYPIPPVNLCMDLYNLQLKVQPAWALNGCVKAKVKVVGASVLPEFLSGFDVPLGCFSAPKPPTQCAQRKVIGKDGVQRTETFCPLPPPTKKTEICKDFSANCEKSLCTKPGYEKVAQIMCGETCGACSQSG
ncbi:hypothetical protein AAVH_33364 [Aphelenchoides avenae]|nr:hypothetical protein AAVH_33364 [Aphelenchus avenae]